MQVYGLTEDVKNYLRDIMGKLPHDQVHQAIAVLDNLEVVGRVKEDKPNEATTKSQPTPKRRGRKPKADKLSKKK